MNKQVLGVIVAVALIILLLPSLVELVWENNIYSSQGEVTLDEATVTFKYNNDMSIYGAYYGNTFDHSLYYDEENLTGTIKFNLDNVVWNESYNANHTSSHNRNSTADTDAVYVNNVNYSKEHFAEDIINNIDDEDLYCDVDINFYSKNGSYIEATYLSSSDYNITVDNNVLTLTFHDENYNQEYNITNAANYTGSLSSTKSKYDEYASAIITITFELEDGTQYILKANIPADKFNSTHM